MDDGRRTTNRGSAADSIDPAALDLRVTSTRVDELHFRMDPALRLAGKAVRSRDYVVLQITLENGATGTAYVLTRGQAIGVAAEKLAHQVLGGSLASLFVVGVGDLGTSPEGRAQALVDNCAWDLAGVVQQTPTWTLLGHSRPRQPGLLVAGYRRHQESDQAMARRLVGWRDKGYRSIKIAANPDDDGATTKVLAHIREQASAEDLELVLDLGFAGRDVGQVVKAAQDWEPYDITWLEDPVSTSAAAETGAIRTLSPLPIAAGDEASPAELADLSKHDAVDVLRADSTTVGGLTGLIEIAESAAVPVSFHIYPEIHRHAAFVMQSASPIETFPPLDCFDFVDRFIRADDLDIDDGMFSAPQTPGLGLRYLPESAESSVVRSKSFSTRLP